MSNVLVNDASLTAIANAIRSKLSTSNTYKPGQMASAIQSIPTGGGSGIKYDTGTFTFESNTTGNTPIISIPHNLGEIPKIVLVWTEDFDSEHPCTANTNGGFIYITDLFNDLPQRLSSSVSAPDNIYGYFSLYSTNIVALSVPTSTSYYPSSRRPTATVFYIPYVSSAWSWRTGVTYKYLLIGGWS